MDVAPTASTPARAATGEDVRAMESEPSSPLRRVTNVIWRAHSGAAHSEGAAQAFLKKEAMSMVITEAAIGVGEREREDLSARGRLRGSGGDVPLWGGRPH